MVNTRSVTRAANSLSAAAREHPITISLFATTRVGDTSFCNCSAFTTSALLSADDFSRIYDMISNENVRRQAIGGSKIETVVLEFASHAHFEAWKQAVPDYEVFIACIDSVFDLRIFAHHPRGTVYYLN